MKQFKKLICIFMAAISIFTLCACGNQEAIKITEDKYVYWVNKIYGNPVIYMDKTITLEGAYTKQVDKQDGKTYTYVYRIGPGCCGNDGALCGFPFMFNGTLPQENDWIYVEGELSTYTTGGTTKICLKASKVETKTERGLVDVSGQENKN